MLERFSLKVVFVMTKYFPIRRSGDAFVIPYLGKGVKNPSTVLYTMDGSHALGASSSKIIKKLAEEARKEEKIS